MQHLEIQLPEKFDRAFGLATVLAALFVVAQVLFSFHTHGHLSNHEDEPASHQVECDVCLVAGTSTNPEEGAGISQLRLNQGETIVVDPTNVWNGRKTAPTQARAPPKV